MELRLIGDGMISKIAVTVLDFLKVENSTKMSSSLTEWLFISSVLVIPNPDHLKKQLQAAECEYIGMLGSNTKRWPHFFGIELGNIMFWEGSPIFKTKAYPISLLQLYLAVKKIDTHGSPNPRLLTHLLQNRKGELETSPRQVC